MLSFRLLVFYAFSECFHFYLLSVYFDASFNKNLSISCPLFSAEISTSCRKSFSKLKFRSKSRERHNCCNNLWISLWKATTKHDTIANDIFWCYCVFWCPWESIDPKTINPFHDINHCRDIFYQAAIVTKEIEFIVIWIKIN